MLRRHVYSLPSSDLKDLEFAIRFHRTFEPRPYPAMKFIDEDVPSPETCEYRRHRRHLLFYPVRYGTRLVVALRWLRRLKSAFVLVAIRTFRGIFKWH